MKCYSPSNLPNVEKFIVDGSTLTVPGLAPSLIELIQANMLGEGLPLTSTPMYDDSDELGMARMQVNRTCISEVFTQGSELEQELNKPVTPPAPSAAEGTEAHEGAGE